MSHSLVESLITIVILRHDYMKANLVCHSTIQRKISIARDELFEA